MCSIFIISLLQTEHLLYILHTFAASYHETVAFYSKVHNLDGSVGNWDRGFIGYQLLEEELNIECEVGERSGVV